MPLNPNLKKNLPVYLDDTTGKTYTKAAESVSNTVTNKTTTKSSPTSSGINKYTAVEASTNPNNPVTMQAASVNILNQENINYITETQSDSAISKYVGNFSIRSLAGIEGVPYQFLPTVDRRVPKEISGTKYSDDSLIGRKYMEKIVTQMPLLFLAPCNPLFMDDKFSQSDKNLITQALAGTVDNLDGLLEGNGRFYSSIEAYTQYYNYLNAMLAAVSVYLGIGDKEISLFGQAGKRKIKNINWADEINTETSASFKSRKNLIFYMDSIDTISESFGNSTQPSMLDSLINGFSDKAKELDYLFGSSKSNLASALINGAGDATGSIAAALGSLGESLGGGIVGSIGNSVNSILDGGKIVFPEMWQDSTYEKSYSISFKLRSPDNDSLSIFLNVLKPYCKLLCFALPHMVGDNVNAYRTPFICRAYSQGRFNIDLGLIGGISATKGATCCWNDDGLPTQIDVEVDIRDLYSKLTMTGFEDDNSYSGNLIGGTIHSLTSAPGQIYNIVSNTSYMDFLANMAGLNINQIAPLRKVKMYFDLASNRASNFVDSTIASRASDWFIHHISRIYR